jgi:hypothetical protein
VVWLSGQPAGQHIRTCSQATMRVLVDAQLVAECVSPQAAHTLHCAAMAQLSAATVCNSSSHLWQPDKTDSCVLLRSPFKLNTRPVQPSLPTIVHPYVVKLRCGIACGYNTWPKLATASEVLCVTVLGCDDNV